MVTTTVRYEFQDALTKKLANAEKELGNFDSALDKVDKKLAKGKGRGGGLFDKVLPSKGKLSKTMGTLSQIPVLNTGIMSSAASLVNPYVAAGAAIAAVGAYTVDATKTALEWNRGMAKANVTIGTTPEKLEAIGDKISKLPRYGAELQSIPDAFTQIVSGVGDTDKSIDVLEYALKASRAGFADLSVSAEAGVNVLNAVGNQAKGASEIFDVLMATMNKGKGEFNDMANYLPKVIPYSNQLGISFKDTAGAFALLSAKGQSIEQTTVLLQNTFSSLSDGRKLKKMQEYIKVFDDKGKIRGLTDIVSDLDKKMTGMTDKKRIKFLDSLGLDQQARSAFGILTQNADELKEFIDYTNNADGALDKALGDSRNAKDNIDAIKEKLENFKLKIGKKIAPFWEKFTGGIVTLMNWLESVEEKTGIFSGAMSILGRVFKWTMLPLRALWNGLKKLWNIGVGAYNFFVGMTQFLEKKFPRAFGFVRTAIDHVVAGLKDMWFVASETWAMMDNLLSGDWDKLGQNISNFRNHDYMNVNGKEATPANAPGGYLDNLTGGALSKLAKKGEKNEKKPLMPPTNTTKIIDADKKRGHKKAKAHAKGIRSVAGGGARVRHVTVNIGKQVEKVVFENTNIQNLSRSKLRSMLEEMLTATVRDAEVALAQ